MHGKHRCNQHSVRPWITGALLTTVLLASFAGYSLAAPEPAGHSTPSINSYPVQTGGNLVIPLSDISEKVKFYPIEIDGIKLEVLAVKAPDGSIRTAFNTCEVCYDSGLGYYKQEGNVLVCQNCGNRFLASQIELQASGCNPWPIFPENKSVDSRNITISYDFLKQTASIFGNWQLSQ